MQNRNYDVVENFDEVWETLFQMFLKLSITSNLFSVARQIIEILQKKFVFFSREIAQFTLDVKE